MSGFVIDFIEIFPYLDEILIPDCHNKRRDFSNMEWLNGNH